MKCELSFLNKTLTSNQKYLKVVSDIVDRIKALFYGNSSQTVIVLNLKMAISFYFGKDTTMISSSRRTLTSSKYIESNTKQFNLSNDTRKLQNLFW